MNHHDQTLQLLAGGIILSEAWTLEDRKLIAQPAMMGDLAESLDRACDYGARRMIERIQCDYDLEPKPHRRSLPTIGEPCRYQPNGSDATIVRTALAIRTVDGRTRIQIAKGRGGWVNASRIFPIEQEPT